MGYAVTCVDATLDPSWDARVEAAPGGDLTQTTLWAATRQQLGFRCLRISVVDPNGVLAGGCMVYARRFAPGLWVGSAPRGPLVFSGDCAIVPLLLRQVIAAARRHGVHLLVVQPPEGVAGIEESVDAFGFRFGVPSIAPDATTRLDLRRSDNELLQAMTSNRRRDIKNALRSDFDVCQDDNVELFYRLHAATAIRQEFDPVTLGNLKAQWDNLAAESKCTMFIARHGGVPVAGIWLTCFAGAVTFKLAGWDASVSSPPHSNEILHWTAIQWARSAGLSVYDFGGIDRDGAERLLTSQPPREGFNRTPSFFKLRFGGTPVLLPRARFAFTNSFANFIFGAAAERIFPSGRFRKFANRIRNGRG